MGLFGSRCELKCKQYVIRCWLKAFCCADRQWRFDVYAKIVWKNKGTNSDKITLIEDALAYFVLLLVITKHGLG